MTNERTIDELLVTRADGVVRIMLNRPQRLNAITPTMWQSLSRLLLDIAESGQDRALVIEGAGRGFCSGADLRAPRPEGLSPIDSMRRIGNTALALHRLPIPTIAKIDGPAVGAGMSLALACDLAVASDRSSFSAIFVKRELSPDFGMTWLLPRLIGLHRAKELALLGDVVSATQAHEMGLLNRVVPADQLEPTVADWLSRLGENSSRVLGMTKSMLNHSMAASFDSAVDYEAHCQAVNIGSPEAERAAASFRER